MFYILKIGDYLKISTDNEVKDFAVINFGEYFKSTKENCILNFVQIRILEKLLNRFISFWQHLMKCKNMLRG